MIPFNKPFLIGNELQYIQQAIAHGKISGNGIFTKKCNEFFEKEYALKKCLLTTSCTDALEMCALLLNIKEGDEVIMPSFTFVSTANAFVMRGAKIVFVDSQSEHPNLDENKIEELITPKTKAIVAVHYAGIACNMALIMALAKRYNLYVVEDAAQAIDAYYKGRPLGSIGNLSTFSFHETKNIISGEGGMLVINDEHFIPRAEIIWEKGTNRAAFWRGEVNKYGWVDIGSSFLPSEIIAAFLYAQLENIEKIQKKRICLWNHYYQLLLPLQEKGYFKLPVIPAHATNNAHMFFMVCNNGKDREGLITYLKSKGVMAVFHYQSLHQSPYYSSKYYGSSLPYSAHYSECLMRLPLYYELKEEEISFIVKLIIEFYELPFHAR